MVGQLLEKLDELGIADNTIVMYSTDNGAEDLTWPDGGTTPFRGEKNTNWEGGCRVPCADTLAGRDQARHRNQRHRLATRTGCQPCWPRPASRTSRRSSEGLQGRRARPSRSISTGTTSVDLLSGKRPGQRQRVLLLDRRRDLLRPALQPVEARVHGAAGPRLQCLAGPAGALRVPKLFSLRSPIPFELADHESGAMSAGYRTRLSVMVPAQAFVAQHLATYKEFPPRQKAASFSLDRVLEKLQETGGGN